MSNDEWLSDEEIIERWEQQDKERAAKASRSADGAGGAATSGQSIGEKTLRIEPGELVRAAEELRDIMAASGQFYERGTPVCIANRKGFAHARDQCNRVWLRFSSIHPR